MKLEQYTPEDHAIMIKMIADFWRIHDAFLNRELDISAYEAQSEKDLQQFNEGKNTLYLAKEAQEVIGFLVLEARGDEVCWINELYVQPEKRGQGYGTAMLEACKTLACQQGYEAISIDVVLRNEAAIRLYQRSGFDTLSLVTLRHDFHDSQRDRTVDLLDFHFKY